MTITTAPRVILGLHHVQISVPESMEQAALQFYTEVMGLIPIDKPRGSRDRGGTWLQLGGLELHLGTEEGVNRRATKAHVAYRVDNLEYWRNRMIENEITPVEAISIPGYDRFEARDPFGNRIEFIQRIG
jgi:catechol 2,3-dioxygenase-like lactoylglutathione lyase family enzyme